MPGFEFKYAENTGMAFSILKSQPELLTILVSVILIYLIYQSYKSQELSIAMALIIAGGLGNLIDRFVQGFVVDFINPTFIDFAVFNIADIALNVGVVIAVIASLSETKVKQSHPLDVPASEIASATPRNDMGEVQ